MNEQLPLQAQPGSKSGSFQLDYKARERCRRLLREFDCALTSATESSNCLLSLPCLDLPESEIHTVRLLASEMTHIVLLLEGYRDKLQGVLQKGKKE